MAVRFPFLLKYDMFCYYNKMGLDETLSRIQGQLNDGRRIREVQGKVIQLRPQGYSFEDQEILQKELEYPVTPGDDWNDTRMLYWRIRDVVSKQLSRQPSPQEARTLTERLEEVQATTRDFERELYDSTNPIRERIESDFNESKSDNKAVNAFRSLMKMLHVDPVFEVEPHAFELEGLVDVLHGYEDGTQLRGETISAMRVLYDITESRRNDLPNYMKAATKVANGIGALMRTDENRNNFWTIGNIMALLPPRKEKSNWDHWHSDTFQDNPEQQRRFDEQAQKLAFINEMIRGYGDGITGKDKDLDVGWNMQGLPWVKEDESDSLYEYRHKKRPRLIAHFSGAFESQRKAALTYFGSERNIPKSLNMPVIELFRAVEGIGQRKPDTYEIPFSPENN